MLSPGPSFIKLRRTWEGEFLNDVIKVRNYFCGIGFIELFDGLFFKTSDVLQNVCKGNADVGIKALSCRLSQYPGGVERYRLKGSS